MRGVTTRRKTKECQERLEKTLTKSLKQRKIISIGSQIDRVEAEVYHNETVWFCPGSQDNRFCNAFGLNPENTQNVTVVEINPPLDGINRQCSGMFAFDQDKSLYLLHNGGIGGGKKGIGKRSFLEWYSEWYSRFDPMRDVENDKGSKINEGILVGNISDERNFLDDLEAFIRKVRFFKQIVKAQTIGSKLSILRSDLQKTGRKADYPKKRATTVSIYERDPIITALAKLMAKGKCRLCKKKGPFRDTLLDLPFLETHHVRWLSRGGKDSIDNTVALCQNCHRKMHHVADKDDIKVLREIAKDQKRLLR